MGGVVPRLARIEAKARQARLDQAREQFFECCSTLCDVELTKAILLWGRGIPEGADQPTALEGEDAQCWAAFVSSGAWQSAQAFCEIVEELPEAEWDHHVKRLLDDPRYQARLPKLQSVAFDLGFR